MNKSLSGISREEIINKLIAVFDGEESEMQFNLTGYTPEAPVVSSNEPFAYEGVVNVLEAEMKVGEKESPFYGTPAGTEYLSICLEVPHDAEENAKRRIYKKFHLNSDIKDSKGKGQAEKLADWIKGAGLTITTGDDIPGLINTLKTNTICAKLWVIKIKNMKDGKEVVDLVQMSKLTESINEPKTGVLY